jgi:hypothetical protein
VLEDKSLSKTLVKMLIWWDNRRNPPATCEAAVVLNWGFIDDYRSRWVSGLLTGTGAKKNRWVDFQRIFPCETSRMFANRYCVFRQWRKIFRTVRNFCTLIPNLFEMIRQWKDQKALKKAFENRT